MKQMIIPDGYRPKLDAYETQLAISLIKKTFQRIFRDALNLKRVSAPLFVGSHSGLNDNLNGTERPVSFDIPAVGETGEVVHSLAKWKRLALKRYGFSVGEGLYTDMNAIRRDEELDNIHSVYVDQWDWEKIITDENRTLSYLSATASAIVNAICDTADSLHVAFPQLTPHLERKLYCISSAELEERYPALTPKEREYAIVKEHKTVLLTQIGGKLKSGKPHDGRAPDYDDWALNGDILFYNEVLDIAFEISSMGVRVNEASLRAQLEERGCLDRASLPFHKMLLAGELPLTIGGGIGQSRLCMLLMGCAHIGEVQASLWDAETRRIAEEHGINLL